MQVTGVSWVPTRIRWRLADLCKTKTELVDSFVTTPETRAWKLPFSSRLLTKAPASITHFPVCPPFASPDNPSRFFPRCWIGSPSDPAADPAEGLSQRRSLFWPLFSDSLRFSLSNRLEGWYSWHSQRPSRSLRDEPASHCLLTVAELAHPTWNVRPTSSTWRPCFSTPWMVWTCRAHLLSEIVYGEGVHAYELAGIRPEVQERITFLFGQQYEC